MRMRHSVSVFVKTQLQLLPELETPAALSLAQAKLWFSEGQLYSFFYIPPFPLIFPQTICCFRDRRKAF